MFFFLMFNNIKNQTSLFFSVLKNLISSLKGLISSILLLLKTATTGTGITFFGYNTKHISFLESFNLMYYYSMPSSIAVVFKKRLNLVFLVVTCLFFALFFL